jgi:hypothetical protein
MHPDEVRILDRLMTLEGLGRLPISSVAIRGEKRQVFFYLTNIIQRRIHRHKSMVCMTKAEVPCAVAHGQP